MLLNKREGKNMKIEQVNFRKKSSDEKILLLMIVGALTALRERKVSVDEMSYFLFHPGKISKLKQKHCRKEILRIVREGCELEDIEDLVPEALPEAVDELYRRAMKLLGEMEEEKRHVWVKIKK